MPFFVVTLVHPDGDGWNKHLAAHVQYLQELLANHTLRASGPLPGTPLRSALLILSVADREEAIAIVEKDPYAIEGLIESMTVMEWNPIFGTYRDEASAYVPESVQPD